MPKAPLIATFSVVAMDLRTGELGVAVQSKFLAVGALVPWAQAGSGALATQARANLAYGPKGLALLQSGLPAEEVVHRLTRDDAGRDHKQLGVVDARGGAAGYTGKACMPWAGHLAGAGYCCQGNVLVSEETVLAMARAYESSQGHLADRLLAALIAGQDAGGDRRGRQSAALYVVREGGGYGGYNDRLVDLRVDDHPDPLAELGRLLYLYRQTFLSPTPPERWELHSTEKVQILQSLLRDAGYFDGAVSGEFTFNTRGSLANWCRDHGLPGMDMSAEWVPGETILALRRQVMRLRGLRG